MCFTLELLSQRADFLNCVLTDVNKEIIKFVGHDVQCPLRRFFWDATANCFPDGIGVVFVIV